jgi:protein involved in polysaccharide export with SLBB domain
MPVPDDYMMGPGDSVTLKLYGKEEGNYELFINNEGNVDIPELGPLSLTGVSYSEAKKLIVEKYEQQKIGVQAFISMGQLKTIQVFLVGEVYRPGTLTLNSLSTVTTALTLEPRRTSHIQRALVVRFLTALYFGERVL